MFARSRQEQLRCGANVQTDLVSIVTHEVGHFIGIAHSPIPSAVMYYSYALGSIKRTLTPDDIAAVCAIYPPSVQKTCDPTPPGGLASGCSTGGSKGCGVSGSEESGTGLLWIALGVAGIGMRGMVKRRRLAS